MRRSAFGIFVAVAAVVACGGLFEQGPPETGPAEDGVTDSTPDAKGGGNDGNAVDANATDVVACDATTCGTACVDLDSDKANCGKCGFDCTGGTCGGGVCTLLDPSLTAGPSLDAYYISVDSKYVWLASGQIAPVLYRIPINGGTPEQVLTGPDYYHGLLATPSDVYFTAGYSIFALSSYPNAIYTQQLQPTDLAFDSASTTMYWDENNIWSPTARSSALPFGAGPVSSVSWPGSYPGISIALGHAVYVETSGQKIYRGDLPLAGNATLFTSSNDMTYAPVGVDSTGSEDIVFFAGYGRIATCDTNGNCTTLAVSGDGVYDSEGLVVDTTRKEVFWSSKLWYPDGHILRTSYPSGTTSSVASVAGVTYRLAQDADAVYWVDGTIPRKAAK